MMGKQTQPVPVADRLERAGQKLEEALQNGHDPRIIGMWKARIKKLEIELESQRKLVLVDEESANSSSPVSSESASSSSRLKPDLRYCLCGCKRANNPGSRFNIGHDARVKSLFNKLSKGLIAFDQLPGPVKQVLGLPDQTVFSLCSVCNLPTMIKGKRCFVHRH